MMIKGYVKGKNLEEDHYYNTYTYIPNSDGPRMQFIQRNLSKVK